jgi:segregation and condensation protein B
MISKPQRDEAGVETATRTSAEPDRRPIQVEDPMDAPILPHRIEALLFASGEVLTPLRISNVLTEPLDDVKAALAQLQETWGRREGAIELVEISGGYRFMTRAAYHEAVAGLKKKTGPDRLSPAALETLAIVAYRQPLARAEVETVRGVQAGPLLRALMDRDLIRVTGRSPEPGHPLLYGTTKRFLDHFGLKSLKQLPDVKDLLD